MEKRKRKQKASLNANQESLYRKCILALVFIAFLWLMFAPQTGFLALLRQRAELKSLQQETQELAAENERLKKEAERLKNDDAYLEEISRRDYDMVKENEILFEFSSRKDKKEKKTIIEPARLMRLLCSAETTSTGAP